MTAPTDSRPRIKLLGTHAGSEVFVTQGTDGLSIDVGGHVITKPVEEWHRLVPLAAASADSLVAEPQPKPFVSYYDRTEPLPAEGSLHPLRPPAITKHEINTHANALRGYIDSLSGDAFQGAIRALGALRDIIDCLAALVPASSLIAEPFQQRVDPWLIACFGETISRDREERNHRFLEESLELVQAGGCTSSEAHQLVDYVFGRAVGELPQEVGGVMVTLAALCLAHGADMHSAAETELERIWTKVDAIRAKQAAKPKHSPLPESPALPVVAATDTTCWLTPRDWESECEECAGIGKVDRSEPLHVDGRYMGESLMRECCNQCGGYGLTVCLAEIPKEIQR